MISYESSNNGHCLRLGGETTQTNNDATGAGVQICFGTFEHQRPCSVALNGNNTVYTGKCQSDGKDPMFNAFPSTFAETPLVVASPKEAAGTTSADTVHLWFSDVMANVSTLSRADFFMNEKHTTSNKVKVAGGYIAIGKYGSTDVAKISEALTASDVRAYWKEGSNVVRIVLSDSTAVQLVSGSVSGSASYSKLNTSLYHAAITPTTSYPAAFSSTPVVMAAPSMKCREWSDDTKFAHPYWFGTIASKNTQITAVHAYSNIAAASKSVYGRYIAIGKSSADVTGWKKVPISLTYNAKTGGYALRFGDEDGGMQLAFGDINFNDRKIQKPLNDVDSSIYTAFKEAPAYKATTDMYFPKAFCESPSTVIMTAQPCRDTDDKTFLHTYWFGDAASDAVSIFNTDLYTNAQFKTDQTVYAKYLAAGKYTAKSDWARDFILKALSYKNTPGFGKISPQEHFLDRYDEIFNHKRKSDNGWCSEFASVVLHEAMQAPINEYPYSTYVKGFIQQFSYPDPERPAYDDKKVSSSTSKFYLGTYDQKNKTTAFHVGKIDSSYNENTYYSYGGTTDAGNDLHFSCTELGIKDVTPQIGDLIFFGHSNTCHTAIVINVNGSHIFTVEGNVDEKQLDIGTSTKNTVLHVRRKISADSSKTNKDRVVGIGDVYACHAALKAKLNASKG